VARGEEFNVLEVETPETLKRSDTAKKLRFLSRHAEQFGGRFWIVVPRGASATALRKLRSLDVAAKVWEVEPAVA
jgi:hypothetical protein